MNRAIRESIRQHYGGRGRVQRIEPFGHVGTAEWGRPFIERVIWGLFGQLKRVARIAVPPRGHNAPRENVITAVTRASIIVAFLLVAARFWRRRS
jgi:hypothetical protein